MIQRSSQIAITAAALLLSSHASGQGCFSQPLGTAQGAGDDTNHINALGWMFTWPGGSVTSDIQIDSNGRVFPVGSQANPDDFTDTTAELLAPGPAVIPYWDDLAGSGAADDVYFSTNGVDTAWIQFNDYRRLSETNEFWSMTLTMRGDGSFSFEYDARLPSGNHDAHVGFSDGVSADPGESDFAATLTTPIDTGSIGTAYEFFNAEAFDLGGSRLDFFPNGMGGYTVIGSSCNLGSAQETGTGCGYDLPEGPPLSVDWIQDGAGGYIVLPDTGVAFDAVNLGTSVGPTDDSIRMGTLGFAFTMPGGAQVTDIDIDSNGRIMAVGADGSDFTPSVAEMLGASGGTINAMWLDFNPAAAGDVLFFTDNVGRANITWQNVTRYGGFNVVVNSMTVQLQLNAGSPSDAGDDTWTVVYESIGSYEPFVNGGFGRDVLIGCSAGNGAADPGESDITATVITNGVPDQYEMFTDIPLEQQDLQTGGGLRVMTLNALSSPRIGFMFDTELFNIPPTAAFGAIAIGTVNLNAPLSVLSPNNPCFLYSSVDFGSAPIVPGSTTASLSLDLTTAGPMIAGLPLVLQGLVADFSAPWSGVGELPIVTSNAVEGVVGF